MRVRLLCDRAGSGFFQEAGSVIDLPEDDALGMIRAGSATAAEPETAAVAPPEEQAIKPAGRPRRREKWGPSS